MSVITGNILDDIGDALLVYSRPLHSEFLNNRAKQSDKDLFFWLHEISQSSEISGVLGDKLTDLYYSLR